MLLNSWFRSRVWGVFLFLGIAAVIGPAMAQPPAPAVNGLPEDFLPGLQAILRTAVTRSPDAIRASIEVEKAEARKIIGAAVRWPTLNGAARYAVNDEAVSGNSGASNRSSGFFYDFSFNQPVYQFGALRAQAEHEKIGLKIAEKQYAEMYRILLQEIRREYLQLVVGKAGLGALRYQLTFNEAAVENQKSRLKEGLAFAGEVAVAEAAVELLKLDIDKAAAALDYGRRSLARLAGVDLLADDTIPAGFARPKPETAAADSLLEAFVHGGVTGTPTAQVYALSIQQNEQDYIVAKHRLHPKFSLFAGYDVRSETQASTNSINQVAVADRNYGLRADWAVFDGWATKGQKLLALAGRRSYERQLQAHVEATADLARSLHAQLGFAARGLGIAERSVDAAHAVLKETQDELAAGRRAPADVDGAKLALARAEATILGKRVEYLNKWTEFVSLVGADPAMNNLPARYVR